VLLSETRVAFSNVAAADVERVALELGRRQWSFWSHAPAMTLDLASQLGVDLMRLRGAVGAPEYLESDARTLHQRLQFLTPDARQHLRAAGFLVARVFREKPRCATNGGRFRWRHRDAPSRRSA
jgi:hypothetical protein